MPTLPNCTSPVPHPSFLTQTLVGEGRGGFRRGGQLPLLFSLSPFFLGSKKTIKFLSSSKILPSTHVFSVLCDIYLQSVLLIYLKLKIQTLFAFQILHLLNFQRSHNINTNSCMK